MIIILNTKGGSGLDSWKIGGFYEFFSQMWMDMLVQGFDRNIYHCFKYNKIMFLLNKIEVLLSRFFCSEYGAIWRLCAVDDIIAHVIVLNKWEKRFKNY